MQFSSNIKWKTVKSLVILILFSQNVNSQNIRSPYKDWTIGANPPPYYQNSNNIMIYNTDPAALPDLVNSWIGEYQTSMIDHFWNSDDINSPIGSIRDEFATTYFMEAVSFPFVPPCAGYALGCADDIAITTPSERIFRLPPDAYSNNAWGDLRRVTDEVIFSNNTDGIVGDYYALAGYSYIKSSSMYISSPLRSVLPQSVIKHTIKIHCDDSPSNLDEAYEMSFVYDNTRGRMRWYPFKEDNHDNASSPQYDLMLRPVMHLQPETVPPTDFLIPFDETSNSDWFDNGSISYFPCDDIPGTCTGLGEAPDCSNDDFLHYDGTNSFIPMFLSIYPSPYSLLSGLLFGDAHADVLAGYDFAANPSPHYIYRGPYCVQAESPFVSKQSLRFRDSALFVLC